MKRLYGRSAKGLRVLDDKPAGRWKTTTMIAAIGLRGVASAMVTPAAINSITFLGFVEEFLAPELRRGDVVVMDNLAVHKVKGVAEAIHAAGAKLLYLPPYSPDLNPIEMAWSKAKTLLRADPQPTFQRLVNAIGRALSAISKDDCYGYFRACGYATTT